MKRRANLKSGEKKRVQAINKVLDEKSTVIEKSKILFNMGK